MTSPAFDLSDTYVSVHTTGEARAVPVDDGFWPEVMAGKRPELASGWLLAGFEYAGDWGTWERHPAGDEIVTLLSGAVDIVLDEGGAERTVSLTAGQTCIVPQGTWHRAVVHEPARAVHLTPGEGTVHRPYEPSASSF
ncbi:MAG TPA: cupin domain-containing protein [Acidimicrobiales bacterium]|nr:cupin domain-containing protein [Acidimicrobiales bacterium]